MIDIGELRDVIYIEEYTNDTDENGFEIEGYKVISKLRAKVKTQATKEFMSANRETTKLTIHVICRNRKYLDSDKFLVYKDVRYNVKHVHVFDDRQFVQLTCEVVE